MVEQHNLILIEMLDKTPENTNTDFNLGLSWSVKAKNSLANVHGISPFQLVLGKNSQIPSVFSWQTTSTINHAY